jgi:CrcB protein
MMGWAAAAVFFGGGLGSVARWALGEACARWFPGYPLGTLLANVAATAMLCGFLVAAGSGKVPRTAVLFVAAGVCGGFSTFSTFAADTLRLAEEAGWAWAAANVAVNVGGCLAAGAWAAALGRQA